MPVQASPSEREILTRWHEAGGGIHTGSASAPISRPWATLTKSDGRGSLHGIRQIALVSMEALSVRATGVQ